MKKYEYKIDECFPNEFEKLLNDRGLENWKYCQTLVNQHMIMNKLSSERSIIVKYLVIMEREII